MKSKLLRLNLNDAIKGIVLAVITVLVTGVYELLSTGVVFDWAHVKSLLLTGLAAALSYIIKNFLTNSNDQLLTKERKK